MTGKGMTLVEELEAAAVELKCGCSAPRMCSRDRIVAALRARAERVRSVEALTRTRAEYSGDTPSLAQMATVDALCGPLPPPASPSEMKGRDR